MEGQDAGFSQATSADFQQLQGVYAVPMNFVNGTGGAPAACSPCTDGSVQTQNVQNPFNLMPQGFVMMGSAQVPPQPAAAPACPTLCPMCTQISTRLLSQTSPSRKLLMSHNDTLLRRQASLNFEDLRRSLPSKCADSPLFKCPLLDNKRDQRFMAEIDRMLDEKIDRIMKPILFALAKMLPDEKKSPATKAEEAEKSIISFCKKGKCYKNHKIVLEMSSSSSSSSSDRCPDKTCRLRRSKSKKYRDRLRSNNSNGNRDYNYNKRRPNKNYNNNGAQISDEDSFERLMNTNLKGKNYRDVFNEGMLITSTPVKRPNKNYNLKAQISDDDSYETLMNLNHKGERSRDIFNEAMLIPNTPVKRRVKPPCPGGCERSKKAVQFNSQNLLAAKHQNSLDLKKNGNSKKYTGSSDSDDSLIEESNKK